MVSGWSDIGPFLHLYLLSPALDGLPSCACLLPPHTTSHQNFLLIISLFRQPPHSARAGGRNEHLSRPLSSSLQRSSSIVCESTAGDKLLQHCWASASRLGTLDCSAAAVLEWAAHRVYWLPSQTAQLDVPSGPSSPLPPDGQALRAHPPL